VDRRHSYVGDSRANELMPFRLAVWRKLGCLKMTRSSWRFNIILDVGRLWVVLRAGYTQSAGCEIDDQSMGDMQAACTCRPSHGDQATRAHSAWRVRVGVKTRGPALSRACCLEVLVPTFDGVGIDR